LPSSDSEGEGANECDKTVALGLRQHDEAPAYVDDDAQSQGSTIIEYEEEDDSSAEGAEREADDNEGGQAPHTGCNIAVAEGQGKTRILQ
jgi:hypothetical protein